MGVWGCPVPIPGCLWTLFIELYGTYRSSRASAIDFFHICQLYTRNGRVDSLILEIVVVSAVWPPLITHSWLINNNNCETFQFKPPKTTRNMDCGQSCKYWWHCSPRCSVTIYNSCTLCCVITRNTYFPCIICWSNVSRVSGFEDFIIDTNSCLNCSSTAVTATEPVLTKLQSKGGAGEHKDDQRRKYLQKLLKESQ